MRILSMPYGRAGHFAALGSLGLLCAAFGFQYLGGLAPCALCLWQRWPHALAFVVFMLDPRFRRFVTPLIGGLSALASAGLGVFHAGVEQGFWKGLQTCSGNTDISTMTAEEALMSIIASPVAKCDEIAWSLLGLSMASWNALVSAFLVGLWFWQARQTRHRLRSS